MEFDLSDLIPWVRRWGSDPLTTARETFTEDGTGEITLGAEADAMIQLVKVTIDGDTYDFESNMQLEGNVLVYDASGIPLGSRIIISYLTAGFTDEAVLGRIVDAVNDVAGELGIAWRVVNNKIVDVPEIAIEQAGDAQTLHMMLQKLIALKAAKELLGDLGQAAARDAILVRDGDTTIDTSKAAAARERALRNVNDEYDKALDRARVRRFGGAAG